eukprot:scaffold19288_cov71-Cylindrotheca_fusiformis.AAC.1
MNTIFWPHRPSPHCDLSSSWQALIQIHHTNLDLKFQICALVPLMAAFNKRRTTQEQRET